MRVWRGKQVRRCHAIGAATPGPRAPLVLAGSGHRPADTRWAMQERSSHGGDLNDDPSMVGSNRVLLLGWVKPKHSRPLPAQDLYRTARLSGFAGARTLRSVGIPADPQRKARARRSRSSRCPHTWSRAATASRNIAFFSLSSSSMRLQSLRFDSEGSPGRDDPLARSGFPAAALSRWCMLPARIIRTGRWPPGSIPMGIRCSVCRGTSSAQLILRGLAIGAARRVGRKRPACSRPLATCSISVRPNARVLFRPLRWPRRCVRCEPAVGGSRRRGSCRRPGTAVLTAQRAA